MKKIGFLVGIYSFVTVVVIFLLMACTTTSIAPINGSYPKKTSDGQCIVTFPSSNIQEFDGISVDWDAFNPTIIPAGKHTISAGRQQYRLTLANRSIKISDRLVRYEEDYIPYLISYKITYEFQKGKEYKIEAHPWEVTYDRKTGELNVTGGALIVLLDRPSISSPAFEIIPKLEVIEVEKKKSLAIGNLFVTPESTWLIDAGMGFGGIRLFPLGNRVGLGFLNGKTDMKLVGLGQFGFFFPINGMAFFGYNFGGLLEYHFPNIGIGLGGGMGGGLVTYETDKAEPKYDFTLDPYFEFNVSLRQNPGRPNHTIYFHYYPSSGEEWFRTIGFGYKLSVFEVGGGGAMYHAGVKAIN